MGRDGLVQPGGVFVQAGNHDDGVIAQHVSPRFENETVNDVEVVILKFGGRRLRFDMEALLANRLRYIMPGLECDQRRSIGGSIVDQLASYTNRKVENGSLEEMPVHERARLQPEQMPKEISKRPGRNGLTARKFISAFA